MRKQYNSILFWLLLLQSANSLRNKKSKYIFFVRKKPTPAQDYVPDESLLYPEYEDEETRGKGRPGQPNMNRPPPEKANTKPPGTVRVYVGFYIESLGTFQAHKMAYDMDMYLRLSWVDKRHQHKQGLKVVNTLEESRNMWFPDLYFANARTAAFQMVMVPNFALWIREDGTMAYSARVILNLACNLNLAEYPLDKQTCLVRIQSYAHPGDEMNVTWFSSDPITRNPEITLPEFSITDLSDDYCDGTYEYATTNEESLTGEFSCLIAKLELTRSKSYHLTQTYIPTAMNVFISWVSFWIEPAAVPARVSLSFTTLLTLATQGTGIRFAIPPVSYAKAIDYWFGCCMIFVFGALIEFAVVNSLIRMSKNYEKMAGPASSMNLTNSDGDFTSTKIEQIAPELKSKVFHDYAVNVDKTCRWAFPLAFLIFNIAYWLIYLVD